MFHLQEHIKKAKTLSEIAGVYWSTRDVDFSPVGNHHFITFIYDGLVQANRMKARGIDYFTEENDKGIAVPYSTVGIGTDGHKGGKLIYGFSPKSDRNSIHEIAKEDNTSWDKPDADYHGHWVPYDRSNPKLTNNEMLMVEILERVLNFNAHYHKGDTIDYSLVDENCAAGVNSIFRVLGYPLSFRKEIGEFPGVDWGEEDVIPSRYYEPLNGTEAVEKETNLDTEITWLSVLLS